MVGPDLWHCTPLRTGSLKTFRDGSSNTQLPWFSTSKDTPLEADVRDAEAYEFVEHGEPRAPGLPSQPLGKPVAYEEGSTIDWLREEAAERERKRVIGQQRGLRGLLSLVQDSVGMWVVIVLTGMGTGVVGAWLDVLVRWCVIPCVCCLWCRSVNMRLCRLGDLREGRCTYGFFYNQVACCSGLDRECAFIDVHVDTNQEAAGEICREWQSWSEYLNVNSIFAQSLLQSAIYIALSVGAQRRGSVLRAVDNSVSRSRLQEVQPSW